MFQRPQQLLRQLAALGYTVLYEDLGDFTHPAVKTLSPTLTLCQGIPALSVPHPRPRILWLTVPYHIHIADQFAPDLIIYDAVDEPKEEFAGWAPYYPAILDRAHLIFASAQSIYNDLERMHPNVHLIPNGVDYTHFSFSNLPKPPDLPHRKPLIGYSGAMAPWVDWELLKFVIRDNPDFQFVFLGTLFQMKHFPLKMPNVKYLGLKRYSQLPAYLRQFSAGLIPFRLTEMTKGCNPIKLYEYYAAGLPVLGTPLPELLKIPKIHLESDPERFSLRLRQIARQDDTWGSERRAFAQANDWASRAFQVSRLLEETLLRKGVMHVTP